MLDIELKGFLDLLKEEIHLVVTTEELVDDRV